MTDSTLLPFFKPRGVVVIGVSRDPTKLGYGLARNLLQCGYTGAMHFVNPKGDMLLGKPIYASVSQIPDPVDLAVILVPPLFVPGVLQECAARGIRAAIIASGGFRETGAEGEALERECLAIAKTQGMRLVGPNVIGLIDTHLPLDTTFLQPPPPTAGEVAFISHSGAICAAVIDWVRGQGFGLAHLISLGNCADVDETDVLAPVAADPHTKVITLYLETIHNGARFISEARQIAAQKPVIALKVGRFEAGKRAAASHTGALAGAETAFDAAFEKAGVMRANTTEEMFQWARALAWSPLPRGQRIAVLTNAGGPGVTAADALEQNGLRLADLKPETLNALKSILPPAASAQNPVDMLASAQPEHYSECLRLLLEDPGVDGVLVIGPPPPTSSAGGVAKAIIPIIQLSEKPVIVALMGDRLIQEGVEFLRAAHIPEYRFPETAASAMAALWQRAVILEQLKEQADVVAGIVPATATQLLEGQIPGAWLPQETVFDLFEAYGIATVKPRLARTVEEAVILAEKTGYPVVMKVASPDIAHKSDVGGVLLNLNNAAAVRTGFEKVIESARTVHPKAKIEGAHVQRMLMPGQDVIAGVVRDPTFGALVMFGSGGVEVEGLKDVAFALAPLTKAEAERMLERTWAGKKLHGFRNLPPADRAAVIQTLIRLAQLAIDCPQIAEIEVNPLRALAEGEGALAVDIRAKLDYK